MAKKKASKKAESAIAITPKCDRYASQFPSWEDFVKATFPEDKYPEIRKTYLK